MHPFILPNTPTWRLANALKLITEQGNGDAALLDLANALRAEILKRGAVK